MKKLLITASAAALLIGTSFAMAAGEGNAGSGSGASVTTSPAVQSEMNSAGKGMTKSDVKSNVKADTKATETTGADSNVTKPADSLKKDQMKK